VTHFRDVLRSLRFHLDQALGKPVSIARFLNEHPPAKVEFPNSNQGITTEKTVRWHDWNWRDNSGNDALLWWSQHRNGFRSSHRCIDELNNFTQCLTLDRWECDIRTIEGLAASKSDLSEFSTLDEFAALESPKEIEEISVRNLSKNLDHREIRIRNSPDGGGDFFVRYLWDGPRTFLINHGGSHHFAAARYIARALDMPVPLSGRLEVCRIPTLSVQELTRKYDLFAMPLFIDYFHEAMKSFKASYGYCKLPRPLDRSAYLIFLPRDEPRSMKASTALRGAGIFDVSDYLKHVCTESAVHTH